MSAPATRAFVVLLAALVGLGPASVDLYLPALPTIAADLGAADARAQWTLASFFLGFGAGMMMFGSLSDKFGRRRLLLFAAVLFAASSLLCVVVTDIDQLIALRFFQAVGSGALGVLARAVVRDVFDTTGSARILSIMGVITAVVPMFATLIGGQILVFAGWRAVFGVLAVLGGAALVLAWWRIGETLPRARRHDMRLLDLFRVYVRIVTDRTAMGYALAGAGTFSAMFAFITGSPFVYIKYYGVAPEWYGVFFMLNILAQMGCTWANGRFVDKVGLRRMTLIGVWIGFAGGVGVMAEVIGGSFGLVGVVVPLLAVIGPTILLNTNANVRLMQLYPDNAGGATAFLYFLLFGLAALSSYSVSMLHDGSPWAMGVVIFTCTALGLCARLFLVRE
jgi:DHA1 family bicyclomycin/chloramphenicol resistance-like MFS transporter